MSFLRSLAGPSPRDEGEGLGIVTAPPYWEEAVEVAVGHNIFECICTAEIWEHINGWGCFPELGVNTSAILYAGSTAEQFKFLQCAVFHFHFSFVLVLYLHLLPFKCIPNGEMFLCHHLSVCNWKQICRGKMLNWHCQAGAGLSGTERSPHLFAF